MRVISINYAKYGSTGKIITGISAKAAEFSVDLGNWVSNSRMNMSKQNVIGFKLSHFIHAKLACMTGYNGCYEYIATKRFIKQVSGQKIDAIHLHNLHNCYINLPLLFRFIKRNNIPVIWTLHDCWAFTGHCPHFTMAKCDKWKTGCHDCPQYRDYPSSLVDKSKTMYKLKKKWFTGVQNMTIVTPSQWLADLVKESFLKDYPVKVIHNGIDLSVFKPTESDFRAKHHCEDKFILLGVAFGWGIRKGLDVFVELSKRLDDRFQIVLVGTDDRVDEQLPSNIISIHRTQNQTELAELYSAANLFVNPTREDNYPTVNMEALACGTPVVTFKTGGSPEVLDETCGSVVDCDDIDALQTEIERIYAKRPYSVESCLQKAAEFDMNARFKEYVDLYKEINHAE